MTVPIQDPIVSYTGNGITTVYAVPFRILVADDLTVLLDGAATTAYSISGLGDDEASITFIAAPASGAQVLIYRQVALDRQIDYQFNGDFLSNTVNADFDRIWMALQDIGASDSRALKFPVEEYDADGTLPGAATRANKVLAFDSTGHQTMVPMPASVGAGDLHTDVFRASNGDFVAGTTTSLTLSRDPGTADNVFVWWDGAPQFDFSLSGSTITFTEPIYPGTTVVRVRTGTTISALVPADGSVGDAQLQWGDGLQRCFSSISSLRATQDTRYHLAFVTGYYAPRDGGGGPYIVDPADTTSADNGGSIIVDGLGRRWKLNTPPDWYVEQFGGGGIGGGADDAVYINKAIAALPDRGGTVRLMGKQYNISTPIHIGNGDGGANKSTKNGVRLIGAGGGFGTASPPPTNIQAFAAIAGAMINITGAISDVYLEGFKLYANLQAEGCIYLTASCGTQIRNVSGNQYTKFGMWWHGGAAPTGNYNINNQINNCIFASTANNHSGLFMDGVASVFNDTWLTTFDACRFDTMSATGSYAGYFAFVDSITFTRCHFVGDNVSGVGKPGSYGVYFNAVGNNDFPSGISFAHCSILSTFVNESTDKMNICTFEGYGTYDNETIPTHPKLIGYTDKGVRFNGWGA
jgi:hypothetical protein